MAYGSAARPSTPACPSTAKRCASRAIAVAREQSGVVAASPRRRCASGASRSSEVARDALRLHRRAGPLDRVVQQTAPVGRASAAPLEEAAIGLAVQARAAAPRALPARRRPARPRPESAGRCAPRRGRSARRAPGPASGSTRCRGRSSRRSAARRTARTPPATAGCRAGRCRRSSADGRRAGPPCRAAPWRSARRAGRRSASSASRGVERALAGEDRDPPPAPFRISARAIEVVVGRQPRDLRRRHRAWSRDVAVRALRRRSTGFSCTSTGIATMGDAAAGQRGAAGQGDDVLDVRRHS